MASVGASTRVSLASASAKAGASVWAWASAEALAYALAIALADVENFVHRGFSTRIGATEPGASKTSNVSRGLVQWRAAFVGTFGAEVARHPEAVDALPPAL